MTCNETGIPIDNCVFFFFWGWRGRGLGANADLASAGGATPARS